MSYLASGSVKVFPYGNSRVSYGDPYSNKLYADNFRKILNSLTDKKCFIASGIIDARTEGTKYIYSVLNNGMPLVLCMDGVVVEIASGTQLISTSSKYVYFKWNNKKTNYDSPSTSESEFDVLEVSASSSIEDDDFKLYFAENGNLLSHARVKYVANLDTLGSVDLGISGIDGKRPLSIN